MISESTITVRYAETDQMGVVYHANYLVWLEIGRTELLEEIGYPYADIEAKGLLSPVLKAELNFGTPLRYGDNALVKTRVVELSSVRVVFYYEIWREGDDVREEKLCCTGRTTHCLVEAGSFKPVSMKKYMPSLYSAYQDALEPLECSRSR